MKRKLRTNYNTPGEAHEFTWSCYRGQPLLRSDRTCQWLAEAIAKARVLYDFELWAYVFMPNHVHLLIRPRRPQYDVAKIRQAIKQPVSQRAVSYLKLCNPDALESMRVVNKDGSVAYKFWQAGGGYDRNLFLPGALRATITYIHSNPVRGGLVLSARSWKWSSAGAYEGMGHGPLPVDIYDVWL